MPGKNVDNINKYKKCCNKTNIVLVGHSYGGDSAMDIADSINKYDGKLVLVTLDPVSQMDQGQIFNIDRSENVDYWINSYVKKGVGNAFSGIPLVTTLWGVTVGTIEAAVRNRDSSDTIAAMGGHWGHESAADVNIGFDAGRPWDDAGNSTYKASHAYAKYL